MPLKSDKTGRWARAFLLSAVLLLSGCGRQSVERLEWTTMGTVAALQVRGETASANDCLDVCRGVCEAVMKEFNAHDPSALLHALAPLPEDEALAQASVFARPCYASAFLLARLSGGAFNPRWRGAETLDFGAIAKGFAVDAMARALSAPEGSDLLIDLGGNLKAVRGSWRTGVRDPSGEGLAATVTLTEGEALSTSAEYFRGKHIYDGRTDKPVSNDVVSVTVLSKSALWADGLSTALFVLGAEEGRRFLETNGKRLEGAGEISVLWILSENRRVLYGPNRFEF